VTLLSPVNQAALLKFCPEITPQSRG